MSANRTKTSAIDALAADWAAHIDRSPLTPEAEAALAAWLAEDVRHQGAFLRAQAIFGMTDRLSVLGAGLDVPAVYDTALLSRRSLVIGGAMLTGATAAGLGFILFNKTQWRMLETDVGETRSIPLADGSTAILNTDTKLAIRLTGNLREVRLMQGEALFQVAKDARRPFVVETGQVRTRAVGTAFAVRRLGVTTDVRVTEGVVEVQSVSAVANVRRVPAGSRTFATNASGPGQVVAAPAEIERSLAWHRGELVFEDLALGEAAEEFNRYNIRHIVVVDADLRAERITGRFHMNEPMAFAHSAAILLDLRTEDDAGEIRLIKK